MSNNIYTTKELIEILAQERQACLMGQRLNLTAEASGNPLIDRFLKSEGAQKFAAYQDFKETIHRYQRENDVSGIVWRQVAVKGKTLRMPEVDAQLIALPSDIETLKAAKPSILAFWYEVTAGMDLYLSVNNGKDFRSISPADVGRISQRTEWAGLCNFEKSDFLEIILQLGWGKPEEAVYKRGWPTSGSEYIHAVKPGNRPIC
ncbi:hypothetical protein H6S82_13115 [Planktothrix sp. FACHB-1355]|uniref:Uncharacterized protein n=1 Tax=Aerosakkonema funiforme FACHB-1375 TaxID=2949571 RepID=A0A926VJ62_9CYAN|nr:MULTISPECIES: hypothetical protein [Oscillatoriales]MBD2184695.1 hypothetical protein [Aerosakkonema funiforme FACHB-1375]MBD3559794.1 hypothetical protein [Planktothrix sp. FACHB-1355]